MPKQSSKRDLNQNAFSIMKQVTNDGPATHHEKNPAAVALGRLGGLKGGKARADSLSKKRLSQIAKKAAQARWARLPEQE